MTNYNISCNVLWINHIGINRWYVWVDIGSIITLEMTSINIYYKTNFRSNCCYIVHTIKYLSLNLYTFDDNQIVWFLEKNTIRLPNYFYYYFFSWSLTLLTASICPINALEEIVKYVPMKWLFRFRPFREWSKKSSSTWPSIVPIPLRISQCFWEGSDVLNLVPRKACLGVPYYLANFNPEPSPRYPSGSHRMYTR